MPWSHCHVSRYGWSLFQYAWEVPEIRRISRPCCLHSEINLTTSGWVSSQSCQRKTPRPPHSSKHFSESFLQYLYVCEPSMKKNVGCPASRKFHIAVSAKCCLIRLAQGWLLNSRPTIRRAIRWKSSLGRFCSGSRSPEKSSGKSTVWIIA